MDTARPTLFLKKMGVCDKIVDNVRTMALQSLQGRYDLIRRQLEAL